MFKNGFTTIGENFVNLVGIGAVLLIVALVMGGGDVAGDAVTYVVELMQWFFIRIAIICLTALMLVLGTIYGIAEVFSRRNYRPLPHKSVSYAINNPNQLGNDAPYFQPSQGDHTLIEGVAETVAEWDDPKDIY